MTPRILVAGMGNELLQDDAFGLAVVRQFAVSGPPDGVTVYEAGTAGIGLVQELMDGYDAVVIVDAADRGQEPGTLFLLETEVPDLDSFDEANRREFLADMHYTLPSKALILGRALDVLPSCIYILGCQPLGYELELNLSEPVAAAVDDAVARLHTIAGELLARPMATEQ